jgi:hypothetical protein
MSSIKIGRMFQTINCLLHHHSLLQSNFGAIRPRFYTTNQTINPLQTHRKCAYSQQIQCPNMGLDLDPYTYTSGRWLRHDKLQIDSRYIEFDFDALCRRVIELSPGATSIATYDKKEGGFNRVFIFTTDNGKTVVARLPFAFAGPPSLTTNSEVATIRYRESQPTPTIKVLH